MTQEIKLEKAPAYRFWVLFINVCAYIAFFVTYQLTAAMGPVIMEKLSLDATALTGLVTACMLGFAVGPVISGKTNAALGARLNVTIWLIAMGLVSLLFLTPLHEIYVAVIILRFCQGMCGGLLVASVVGSVNAWFPRKEAGIATGVTIGILGVGMSIASFIVPPFFAAGFEWNQVLAICACTLSVVVAIIYWFTIKNFNSVFPGYDKISQILEGNMDGVNTNVKLPKRAQKYTMPSTMGKFLVTSVFWCMAGYSFIKCAFTYGLSALFPQLLSIEMGLDMSVVSAVTGATFFITVICAPLGGLISGTVFKGMRWQIMAIGSVLTVVTLVLIPLTSDILILNILLAVCYGSTALGTGAYWSLSTEVVHPAIAPKANGLLSGIANAGGTVVPILLAALATSLGSYSACFYILAIAAAVQLFCAWRVGR